MHTETTPIAIITVKESSSEFRRKISGITLNSTLTGLVSMKRQFIETYFDKKSFESKQLLDEIRKLEVLSSANSFHIASGKSWDYLLKILGKASSCAKINDFCKLHAEKRSNFTKKPCFYKVRVNSSIKILKVSRFYKSQSVEKTI